MIWSRVLFTNKSMTAINIWRGTDRIFNILKAGQISFSRNYICQDMQNAH